MKLSTYLLALVLVSACTDPDPNDPMGECTSETDVVPIDEIAASVHRSPTLGDITIGRDKTVYFVSGIMTIGRRAVCGAVEKSWRTFPTVIEELEVSSDNQLYVAATNSMSSQLYRIALDYADAKASLLIDKAGERIRSLSAGTGGDVYFVMGSEWRSIYFIETRALSPTTVFTLGSANATLAANPFGNVEVLREDHGMYSTATLSAYPGSVPIFTTIPPGSEHAYWFDEMRTDEVGGIYGVRVQGTGAARTVKLIHFDPFDTARTTIAEITSSDARAAFAVDGDLTSALFLTTPAKQFTLPVPVMMP